MACVSARQPMTDAEAKAWAAAYVNDWMPRVAARVRAEGLGEKWMADLRSRRREASRSRRARKAA